MELNEVGRRILAQHWLLIFCAVALGIGLAFAELEREGGATYEASARLVLGTQDPASRVEAGVIADTAKALATTPSQTRAALEAAQVTDRDPIDFAKHHVAVQALGSSGVIELSVTDRDPRVASAVANALAQRVVQTRSRLGAGEVQHVLADLDRELAALSRRISAYDATIDALNTQIATAQSATRAITLRASRDEASRSRDFLAQRRAVLESEQVSLLSAASLRPRPLLIGRATVPERATSSHRVAILFLGGLLGLIVGLGLAGLSETLRPTVVGPHALADELNTPLLGTLSDAQEAGVADTAARLRLAAAAAGVGNVGLVAIGANVDLDRLAARLQARSMGAAGQNAPGAAGGPAAYGHPEHGLPVCHVKPFAPHNASLNGGGTGVILVSPMKLKKAELRDTSHLLSVTPFPVLGLITHTSRRSRRRSPQLAPSLDQR